MSTFPTLLLLGALWLASGIWALIVLRQVGPLPLPNLDHGPDQAAKRQAVTLHLLGLTAFLIPGLHLIVSLIYWRRHRSNGFVDLHGRAAVNVQLNAVIAWFICAWFAFLIIGFPAALLVAGYLLYFAIRGVAGARAGREIAIPGPIQLIPQA